MRQAKEVYQPLFPFGIIISPIEAICLQTYTCTTGLHKSYFEFTERFCHLQEEKAQRDKGTKA